MLDIIASNEYIVPGDTNFALSLSVNQMHQEYELSGKLIIDLGKYTKTQWNDQK